MWPLVRWFATLLILFVTKKLRCDFILSNCFFGNGFFSSGVGRFAEGLQ